MAAEEFAAEYHRSQITIKKKKKKKKSGKRVKSSSVQKQIVKLLFNFLNKEKNVWNSCFQLRQHH